MDIRTQIEIDAMHRPWMRLGTVATFLGLTPKFVKNCTQRDLITMAPELPSQGYKLYSFANALEAWAIDHVAKTGGTMETGRAIGMVLVARAEEMLRRGWGSVHNRSEWGYCDLQSKPEMLAYVVTAHLTIDHRFVAPETPAAEIAKTFELGRHKKSGTRYEVRLLAADIAILSLMRDYCEEVYGNPSAWERNGWGPHNE